MAKLYKTPRQGPAKDAPAGTAELLIENLIVADTFFTRGMGLLGRKDIAPNEALWIKRTNNIHTWFMRMQIDCIFIDRNLEIKKIVSNIPAFRFVGPFWKSSSVIETQAGFAESKNLKVGDQLHVVN